MNNKQFKITSIDALTGHILSLVPGQRHGHRHRRDLRRDRVERHDPDDDRRRRTPALTFQLTPAPWPPSPAPSGSWIVDGFGVGTKIYVSGTGNQQNNNIFLIAAIDSTEKILTLAPADEHFAEGPVTNVRVTKGGTVVNGTTFLDNGTTATVTLSSNTWAGLGASAGQQRHPLGHDQQRSRLHHRIRRRGHGPACHHPDPDRPADQPDRCPPGVSVVSLFVHTGGDTAIHDRFDPGLQPGRRRSADPTPSAPAYTPPSFSGPLHRRPGSLAEQPQRLLLPPRRDRPGQPDDVSGNRDLQPQAPATSRSTPRPTPSPWPRACTCPASRRSRCRSPPWPCTPPATVCSISAPSPSRSASPSPMTRGTPGTRR